MRYCNMNRDGLKNMVPHTVLDDSPSPGRVRSLHRDVTIGNKQLSDKDKDFFELFWRFLYTAYSSITMRHLSSEERVLLVLRALGFWPINSILLPGENP